MSAPGQPDHEPPCGYDAAVLIVNYRTPELVERCLESVRAGCGKLRLESIVIDSASQDGSLERLRAGQPGTSVLPLPSNRGFAAGVNAGFSNTEADIVIVLNPDTTVHAGSLQALIASLRRRPRAGIVAPLVEGPGGQLAPNGYRRFPGLFMLAFDLCVPLSYLVAPAPSLHPYVMSPAALQAGHRPAHVSGAAMAIRRAAYLEAGPFDEGFFLYLEETEWQQRLLRKGWTIELEPAARVCHLERGGGEESLAHSPYFIASALRYLRMQGVPLVVSRVVLSVSLTISWVTLRLISCIPSKRASAALRARVYGSLLRKALTEPVAV